MDIKNIVNNVDSHTRLPVFSTVKRMYRAYAENSALNAIRRRRDWIQGYFHSRDWDEPVSLHLGCGYQRQPGAIDIDFVHTTATDYVLDASNLPFPENSVSQIESYHMVEHIPTRTIDRMLVEWNRVLQPGGTLVLELPDFDGVVETYLDADDPDKIELLLKYVFGSQRFESDYHHWGWNFERLSDRIERAGFDQVERKPPQDYHAQEAPCMRLEATV